LSRNKFSSSLAETLTACFLVILLTAWANIIAENMARKSRASKGKPGKSRTTARAKPGSLSKKAVRAVQRRMPGRKVVPFSKNKTIVVALGGSAIVRRGQPGHIHEQLGNIDHAMEQVARLVRHGYRVVITHGNGPQLDNIILHQESTIGAPKMPLHANIAQTQGLIGYVLQEALYSKLHEMKLRVPVVAMLTQSLVDRDDKSFSKPMTPVGPYFPNEEELPAHWHVAESVRGSRRAVASPVPKRVMEAKAIQSLLDKAVVIAGGGGGIPVVQDKLHVSGRGKKKGIYGVEALIDKDLATAIIASSVKADLMVMLTDVEGVHTNWDEPRKRLCLERLSLKRAKSLLAQGHFPFGSMRPKIEASIRFLESGGKKVVITDADRMNASLKGKAGTVIEP